MDAPPADLPDVAQAPPEKVVAYLRYLNFFYHVHKFKIVIFNKFYLGIFLTYCILYFKI